MTEQQVAAQSAQETETGNLEKMTQLEGIRQKVFMDRYSLKDPSGNALEHYPEQMWARVARGIAEVEQTPEARAEWEKKFYDALAGFQFVPGGRILAGAGSGHSVTFYNCMPPEQEVLTDKGYRPIAEIQVGDLVVTHRNRLRPVLHKFEREADETLYIIRPKKVGFDELRVTGEHKVYVIRSEWVNTHKSRDGLRLQHEPDWIPAKEMKPGDYVAVVAYSSDTCPSDFEYDDLKWVRVDEIAMEEYSGNVLDIEVEEDHSFISADIVVSNCFVIPSPEDSRQGILDNLKLMTEIMARGGGVGINLSTLRPRGSYIRTVNGTASGPCSWAQLYSVATGDVIQQGGCFGPDERIATDRGLIPVKELVARLENGETIQARTHKGFRSFTYVFHNGKKDLYEVTTGRGYKVRVTLDHKMGVLHKGEITTIPLHELTEGDEILLLLGNTQENAIPPVPLKASEYVRSKMSATLNENVILPTHLTRDLAYLLGFFYGDSSVIQGRKVTWQDEKGIAFTIEDSRPAIRNHLITCVQELFGLEPILTKGDGACTTIQVYSRILVEWLQSNGLLKQKTAHVRVPEAIFQSPVEVVSAFIGGFFDADGCDHGSKGGYGIDSVSREMLEDLQLLLLQHGIMSHITTQDRTIEGWLDIHRLIISGAQFRQRFSDFIACCKDTQRQGHRSHFSNYPMEVWDTLGIPGRYYQGLFDSTKERVSHYALTRVRDRLAAAGSVALVEKLDELLNVLPDKIVSIKLLGPSDVYDFEVDDVHLLSGGGIYTSNSRRGALMLMLDDDHPDIEEFITVKRTPGKIEHANLSVCISDAFMQAVKDDADWNLIWQGEVKKTVRARDLWDLICTSAWESAEPGVVFMDRYNKLSNTWYYENIRCVNPCGEQGLPAFGVCNLGALNLSVFVENGQMNYERLAEKTKVAMRFLDNVVDATEYFIPENAEAQLGTRRTGLGTMGLADALIKMKIAYGSDESIPVIEKIYTTIRDAAYEASADYAAEKGAFPHFERDKYMQGQFIKQLPKTIQEKIRKHGTRNAVLLTQAPTGTTSLLAGVSSGIEPVYDFAMIRRDRTGEHILYHPLLQAWRDEHPNEPTPAYFVSSKDLSPEEHVRVQATIQKYTDSSISKCVVGDTLVSTERGLLPIADLYVGEQPDTFRSLALHVASLKGTQLASHFYFGGIKPTQRVKLADGHEITGTPNHQLYVGTPEGLVWKRLDELLPGDYVALKIGAQLFGTDVPLHGFQQSTIRAGYHKSISVPASMNPVLAHFIGSYIAEGCIVHHTVRITNNEESVLERLREECRMLFGLDGNIIPQGRHNALTLQINSKSLCELLRFLGCEGLAAQKTIPWSILQSSRESIVAFLSGLYLDGFITETKVGICLASQKLIQQLQIVLDNLGVQSWITVRHNVEYNRDYYELNAHGQEAQRILRLLTLDETHKRERALKLLQREFQHNKSDLLPIEVRKSLFADASRTVRYRHHSYSQALPQDRKGKMLSWFGLRRLANDPEVQLTPSLQEIWQESLHFRRVLAVENSGEQPVYDLSVPSTTAFIGNGIVNHNTVNAPNEHTVDQVQTLYRLAYEMGCKGVTYYRDGSRDAVLTRIEDEKKAEQKVEEQAIMMEPVASIQQGIKPLPAVVNGYTRHLNSPEGKVNITINSDEQGPLEVFINVGKAGSDIAALAEALGRLISLNLRILSPLSQIDRTKVIAEQLRSIGGSRSVGFGAQQVRSMPDAVARALELHIASLQQEAEQQLESAPSANGHSNHNSENDPQAGEASPLTLSKLSITGNLCPECGCNTMVFEEGCKKCYTCGHSEC